MSLRCSWHESPVKRRGHNVRPSSRKQSYSLFHTPQGSDASHSLLSWLSSWLLLLCPSWLMMIPSRSLPRVQWVLWRDREPSRMLLRQMYTKKKAEGTSCMFWIWRYLDGLKSLVRHTGDNNEVFMGTCWYWLGFLLGSRLSYRVAGVIPVLRNTAAPIMRAVLGNWDFFWRLNYSKVYKLSTALNIIFSVLKWEG